MALGSAYASSRWAAISAAAAGPEVAVTAGAIATAWGAPDRKLQNHVTPCCAVGMTASLARAYIRADFFHDSQSHWLPEKHLSKMGAEYCLMPVLVMTGGAGATGTTGGGC